MQKKLIFTYEDFKININNRSLNQYEKMGFPTKYRKGYENLIFNSYKNKLINLKKKKIKILEIGPGYSNLSKKIIKLSTKNNNSLFFLDSKEILKNFKNHKCLKKIEGEFPYSKKFNIKHKNSFDVIICYSVFHYIIQKTDYKRAIKKIFQLLKTGGEIYIGDLPNLDMLKRFLKSENGKELHKKNFTKKINLKKIKNKNNFKLSDNVILDILEYFRRNGCHSYLIPQEINLPLSNRREDIYIKRLF